MEVCKAAETGWRAEKGAKQGKRQPKTSRYVFIWRLSVIFESYFDQAPTTTRDGPWCSFLAAVFSRREGELSNSGAYDLWRNAQKMRNGRKLIGRKPLRTKMRLQT
jgi:hypothetical protein